jgi:nitroreductase/NAD-dependent dihydropyrimidine dehydrogenase PreA subunit
VTIDQDACTLCGLCLEVCKGAPLYLEDGRIQVDQDRLFGCIACGQCAAVCPQDCIAVTGRDLAPEDFFPLPRKQAAAAYPALHNLMQRRRSVRNFAPREVPAEFVEQILAAAATSPMGIPPSQVGVLVAHGFEQVRRFKNLVLGEMLTWRRWTHPLALALMRPFIGPENYTMFSQFIRPALDAYEQKEREGVDWFFYGAPIALYFYASMYADPADPVVAAVHAMLAAESLGLGTCMLGFPGYVFQQSKPLRARYGLPGKIQPGLAMVCGYPSIRFTRGIRRRFARVSRVEENLSGGEPHAGMW